MPRKRSDKHAQRAGVINEKLPREDELFLMMENIKTKVTEYEKQNQLLVELFTQLQARVKIIKNGYIHPTLIFFGKLFFDMIHLF